MADNAKDGAAAPDLKVVKKDDPGPDLIALASSALAETKKEIRKEVLTMGAAIGIGLYFLLGGPKRSPKWLRRITG